ncbi:hypothetical protein CBR_g39514 [Chara braunii]|uniref:Exonuclease domain-containing protein n=1 Tax=Chara braunii TaxID=69332 RepID=A0A388LS10_CHABU|nr:hypothetical protein CBR_g39514 [Chara braunii]|eukprot:GBG85051.1 hypothetical protein CBR_g39514 [Chara braunii]
MDKFDMVNFDMVNFDMDNFAGGPDSSAGGSSKKLKKQRQLVFAGKGTRNDYFDVYGPTARAELSFTTSQVPCNEIRIQDISQLILWVLGEAPNPRWVFVKNKPLISKVVLVLLSGLDAALFNARPDLFPGLSRCFGKPCTVSAINPVIDSLATASALLSFPSNKKPPAKRKGTAAFLEGLREKKQVLPDSESRAEVLKRLRLMMGDGFLFTQPPERGKVFHEMAALDCEMCQTQEGLEVTRISMVDTNGKVLLDRLVKPKNPITDYLTQYSGITPELLNDVTTTLADVQKDFLKLVSADTFLVGHSLDSDLKALQIVHHRVIDTAFIYPHPRGPPFRPALRILSEMFLKRKIQDRRKLGHDSIEDARAAMDLTKLKIHNGPSFGEPSSKLGESLVAQLGEYGRRCSLVDKAKALHRLVKGTASAIQCSTDEDVLSKASKEAQSDKVSFVWARFSDLSSFYEQRSRSLDAVATEAAELAAMMTCTSSTAIEGRIKQDTAAEAIDDEPDNAEDDPCAEGSDAVTHLSNGAALAKSTTSGSDVIARRLPWMEPRVSAELEKQLRMVDARVAALHEALPTNSLFIVATGHGDTALVRR